MLDVTDFFTFYTAYTFKTIKSSFSSLPPHYFTSKTIFLNLILKVLCCMKSESIVAEISKILLQQNKILSFIHNIYGTFTRKMTFSRTNVI